MAVRLSGRDTNSSRPRRLLPTELFPAPDRPSNTRRSSGEEEDNDEEEEEMDGREDKVGEASGEELSPKLLILW